MTNIDVYNNYRELLESIMTDNNATDLVFSESLLKNSKEEIREALNLICINSNDKGVIDFCNQGLLMLNNFVEDVKYIHMKTSLMKLYNDEKKETVYINFDKLLDSGKYMISGTRLSMNPGTVIELMIPDKFISEEDARKYIAREFIAKGYNLI